MAAGFSRVFTLEVDGRPVLAFEAGNTGEAKQLCKESWLKEDLTLLKSNGAALLTPQSNLSVRAATAEETVVFDHVAKLAKPTEDLVLAYLIELDSPEDE